MPTIYEPNFNPQNRIHDIVSEGELANILSHYNDDFIIGTVQDNVAQKRNQSGNIIQMPNFVGALEQDFKYLFSVYTSDIDEIKERRSSIYRSIIDILCKDYNLTFLDVGEDRVDYYSLAFCMYDFLVCNFDLYMINFFTQFISQNAETIYNALDLGNAKKTKDTASIYAKQLFSDPKIGAISSNLKTVLTSISSYIIEFRTILNTVLIPQMATLIATHITPNNDFYKDVYCTYMLNENTLPINITNIRLEFQKRYKTMNYTAPIPTTNDPISLNTKEDNSNVQ